jgi:cell division cycle protein 37
VLTLPQYVPPKPAPPPIKNAIADPGTKTTTAYEVLNPAASAADPPPAADAPRDEDEQQEDLPELTPSLAHFSRVPLWDYAQSFAFIQSNRDVVVPGASDALLVAAFQAENDLREKYAKQCVHQSLLLQYCDKLGRDGVRVFFQKWVAPLHRDRI